MSKMTGVCVLTVSLIIVGVIGYALWPMVETPWLNEVVGRTGVAIRAITLGAGFAIACVIVAWFWFMVLTRR